MMTKFTKTVLITGLVTGLGVTWSHAAEKDRESIAPAAPSATAIPQADPTPSPAPSSTASNAPIPSLYEIQGWRPALKTTSTQEPSLRERALRETGLQVGSQTALAAKTREQNTEVETYARWLNDIYRFDQLLSEKGLVLPPIIIETRRHAQVDGVRLTKIEQSYKMIENAQVVSAPPTWRDYLIAAHYPPPPKPEGALLPQNATEEHIWSEAVRRGWEQGEQQAFLAFKARVGELHRAFLGRVRYLVLLERGLVTAPAIKIARRGVKQDANELLIGRTEITLSRLSEFRVPPVSVKKGQKTHPWRAMPEVLTTYDDGSSVQ